MRLNATRLGSIASSRSFGDQLDDLAGQVPSLDLNFAQNKSLIDDYSGTTLVTFTRASSGTYVDSEGVIRQAVTNLLLRSEEFDNASWAKGDVTVQENAALAPNGSTLADKLIASATTAVHNISQAVTASSAAHTFSIYLKAAELTTVSIRAGRSGNFVNADINLSLGTIASPTTSGTATNVSSSIQSVSNDWYRCSVTGSNLGDGQIAPVIYIPDDASLPGDGTSGIYVWGAQLEQSSTVGEYIPTTSTINSAPRFDHDPQTGESLGLLVEEQRVNNLVQSENFSATWSLNAVTVGASITAPNGTTTAQKLEETATTAEHRATQPSAGGATTAAVTFTVFAKAAERTKVRLAFSGLSNWTGGGGAAVIFDLSAGTAVTVSSTPTAFSITPFANGWYRCSITGTPTSSLTPIGNIFLYTTANNYAGTLGDGIYLWGAQLETGSFPTSYIPTVAATVTRAADVASITGSNFGTTRTNLLVRSEEFDDAAWTKSSASITANTTTAPDGTITADTYSGTGSSGVRQTVTLTSGTVYTISFYVKSAGLGNDGFRLVINSAQSSSNFTATSEWQRFTFTATSANTGARTCGIHRNSSGGNVDVLIWGAQLEVGSAVTPYIQSPSVFTSRASSGTYVGGNGLIQTATTNEARYDHDPVSLIGKGLLLEEARTNLSLYSEDFGNAIYSLTAATVSTNTTAAPDGTTTADTVNSSGTAVVSQSFTKAASAITYTGSLFVKGSATDFSVTIDDGTPTNRGRARFNLSTGTLGSVTNDGTFTGTTSTITLFPNDWYRLTVTTTTNTLTTARLRSFWTGAGTSINFWGAQLEAGAFATSYIPTTTATVTRAADISTSVATSVFESSWYRQDEGTVFAEASPKSGTAFVGFNDGTTSNRIRLAHTGTSAAIAVNVTGGALQFSINSGAASFPVNTQGKAALAMKASDFALVGNTSSVVTSTGLMPSMNQATIGSAIGVTTPPSINGHIRRLTYWPTRLSNEVLQRITQ
jgi:hypothetical protein